MKILKKYILLSVIKLFFILIIILLVVASFIDTLYLIKDNKSLGSMDILRFNFYVVPFHIYLVLPLSLFLSVLLTISMLEFHNEITAICISGIKLSCIYSIIIIFSIVIFIISILNTELILPYTYKKMNIIKYGHSYYNDYKIKTDIKYVSSSGKFYIINSFDSEDNSITGISIQDKDIDGNSVIYTSNYGYYTDNMWGIKEVVKRTIKGSGKSIVEEKIPLYKVSELPSPDKLILLNKVSFLKKEELRLIELLKIVPYSNTSLQLHRKVLVSLFSKTIYFIDYILLSVLGVLMGIYRKNIRSGAGNVGIGILIFLLFNVFVRYGYLFGYQGIIPSLLSCLLGDLFLFLCIIFYLYKLSSRGVFFS
ncbi:MAG: LptF/LptG family permease [Candidatus Hydrogenedentota bacterium]